MKRKRSKSHEIGNALYQTYHLAEHETADDKVLDDADKGWWFDEAEMGFLPHIKDDGEPDRTLCYPPESDVSSDELIPNGEKGQMYNGILTPDMEDAQDPKKGIDTNE